MAKPRNKFLDYLAYVGFRVFESFVLMFDVRTNYHTFDLLGELAWRVDRRHRRRALGHLQRSFPNWSQQQCRRVARASIRNFFRLGLEMLFTARLITPLRWRRHVRLSNAARLLRMMIDRDHPLVMVTGHFGNWEVVGHTMSVLGFPTFAVARAMDNPRLGDYLTSLRQRSGLTILDKKGATDRVDEVLGSNGMLGWVADQDAGRKGMFVDFFGRSASTFKSIALLAMSYRAAVVVGYGLRLDLQYRFEFGIQRIIEPREWADKDDPARWITQEFTSALEQVVRLHPEQYLWAHRRWKHRPKGQPATADGIA